MTKKNSEIPVSKLAIRATQKKANGLSRNAERTQQSINSLEKVIEKLKASKDSISSFALNRKINELKVLQNKYGNIMFKYNNAEALLNSYVAKNEAIRNVGSN